MKAFYLETNAFEFVLETILSQIEKDRKLYLIKFYSKKFWVIEINYEIHNKELLTIIDYF